MNLHTHCVLFVRITQQIIQNLVSNY